MKIMIVDDEQQILEGLTHLITNHVPPDVTILSAKDGQEALDIDAEHNCDIIITDIVMPKKNGIQTAQELITRNPDLRVIVISGFNDVNYVKQCLRFGAVNFVFKPISPSELIESVKKAMEDVEALAQRRQEQRRMQRITQTALPYLRAQFLQVLISEEEKDAADVAENMALLEIAFRNHSVFRAALITGAYCKRAAKEYFTAGTEHDLRQIQDLCAAERPVPICAETLALASGEIVVLMGVLQGDPQGQQEKEGLRHVLECGRARGMALDHIVLGSPVADAALLNQSFSQAMRLRGLRFLNPKEDVLAQQDLPKDIQGRSSCFPGHQMMQWIRHYRNNQWEALAMEWRVFFRTLPRDQSLEHVKSVWSLFLQDLVHQDDTVPSDQSAWEFLSLDDLAHMDSLKALENWLMDRLHRLQAVNKPVHTTRVAQVVDAVRNLLAEHYMQPVNVQWLANAIHVNSNYLSTVFKQETGVNLIDALSALRMQKAKELIEKTDSTLSTISRMVGYSNLNYFSRVFKKHYGTNPNALRKGGEREIDAVDSSDA